MNCSLRPKRTPQTLDRRATPSDEHRPRSEWPPDDASESSSAADNKGLVSDRKGDIHMELAEHWRWCYRDAATGRVCRTSFQLTAEEAERRFHGAERIEGSMTLREVDLHAVAETAPRVFHEPQRSVS